MDFRSASRTINLNKILIIMDDLGFPLDCIYWYVDS